MGTAVAIVELKLVSAKFNYKHIYARFNGVIEKSRLWLKPRLFKTFGVEADIICDRLLQVIAYGALADYIKLCSNRFKEGEANILPGNICLKFNHFHLNQETGKVKIKNLFLLKYCLRFLSHWSKLFLAIIYGGFISPKCAVNKPVTLLQGVPIQWILYNDTDERFIEFCRKGSILPLSQAKELWIESNDFIHTQATEFIHYVKTTRALRDLLAHSYIDIVDRIKLLLSHSYLPIQFLYIVFRFPLLSLLAKDIAELPVARSLVHAKCLKTIVQASGGLEQPLWMRCNAIGCLAVHMQHHSQNSRPMVYKGEDLSKTSMHHPIWKYTYADVHWVWTKGYRAYWKELNPKSEINVVGPILGYLPKEALSKRTGAVRIGIFDVDPRREEVVKENFYDEIYTPDSMISFIEDIIAASRAVSAKASLEFELCLKGKVRSAAGMSQISPMYQSVLQKYTDVGILRIFDRQENMYALISSCDCVLAIPYTSPAYVADYLEVPAIYYDPTKALEPTYEASRHICFASGEQELYKKLSGILL